MSTSLEGLKVVTDTINVTRATGSQSNIIPVRAYNFNQLVDKVGAIVDGSITLAVEEAGDGTVALPSITFVNDTASGFYKIGTSNIGLTLAGTKSVDFGVNLVGVTGAITASTSITAGTIFSSTAGTVGAPGITFTGDLDTGLYHVGANAFTLVANGAAVAAITTTGLGVTGTIVSSSTITAISSSITAGTVFLGSAGAVGAPTYSFTSTATQGMYSVSGTQLGFSNGAAGLNLVVDTTGISTGSVKAQVAIGTTPVGTVTFIEYSTGRDVLVELTLTNFIVGALAGAGAALGLGNIVYAVPAGQHLELVYSLSAIVLTCAGTAVVTDTGLGSVIAVGAVSVLDGTATFEDRLTGIAITTGASGGAAASSIAGATAGIGTGIAVNGTGAIKNVFLNSAGTWNANNTGNLTATGKIYMKYSRL